MDVVIKYIIYYILYDVILWSLLYFRRKYYSSDPVTKDGLHKVKFQLRRFNNRSNCLSQRCIRAAIPAKSNGPSWPAAGKRMGKLQEHPLP